MWKIEIEKCDNGFLLTWLEDVNSEYPIINKRIIEAQCSDGDEGRYNTDNEEKLAVAKLLEFIAEYFGCMYDKFKEDNLNIKFNKKGHKL